MEKITDTHRMKNQPDQIRETIRERYGKVVEIHTQESSSCCGPTCCEGDAEAIKYIDSGRMGYSEAELSSLPVGADLGLGCGNPQGIASLQTGETVLDLGSGAGIDCFLAAKQVGSTGRVIGVDMTPAMITKARGYAQQADLPQVAFRLGEIEHLPLSDASVDVIISNCVINLSPEKEQVFREAFRVLRPGGRLAISDVVASTEIPEEVRADLHLLSACVAGASTVDALSQMLQEAGFEAIRIHPKEESREFIRDWVPGRKIDELILSSTIQARKPEKTEVS